MTNEIIKPKQFTLTRTRAALAAVGLIGLGAITGSAANRMAGPRVEMAPAVLTPIHGLTAGDDAVTIKGQIVEVFGDRFVLTDGTGRALVELGHQHGAASPAVGQLVTVQGHFDRSAVRASFIIGADGKVISVRAGGRHGERQGNEGHGDDRGSNSSGATPS